MATTQMIETLPQLTRSQRQFLEQWTWFDSQKARNFSDQGDAKGAGEWARSAAHDVLHSEDLAGLLESMAADTSPRKTRHYVAL